MKRTNFFKSLLLAAGLCVGAISVHANDTFGSLAEGWWQNFSQTYTLEGYGKFHFQFTTTNLANDVSWKTWLLVATNGADSHGSGGTEYFAWRGDSYAWGQGKNSNAYDETKNVDGDPTNLVCSNTYAMENPSGAGLMQAMNGATVDMIITRTSSNISAEATVTPTLKDENPFTMSFSYLYGNATSENIGLFFEVENSTMDISTAENYYNVTRYSQYYEDATNWNAGWDSYGSQADGNGGKVFYVGNLNGAKTCTLSFANNNYFQTATDYIFSFEYAFSSGNGNAGASSLIIKDTEGNALFTLSNSGNWSETCDGTYGETTITEVYHAPYNALADAIYATFTLTANEEDGVVLSVSGTSKTITNNKAEKTVGVINPIYSVKIADFARIGSIVLNAARAASHYAIDNMFFKEHTATAVAEDPSFAFKSVSGENRVYTITNPNGEGTLYYTTATAADAPAVGDAAYTSTTESSIDVAFGTGTYYAYAVLADGTTTSAVISQEVTGGEIQLVKPYYTIISYDESAAKTTVTLNTNVGGLLGTPTATIKYTIDEGEEQSTTNGGTVLVADGTTITFYAEAEGYTTSEAVSAMATAPNNEPELWTETYNGIVSSNKGFTLGTDVIATENSANYYYLYYDETEQLSERFLANNVYNNNMIRPNGYYSGQTAALAIYNLKKGDYVTFTGAYGNGNFVITANSSDFEADAWHTINGSQYCYTVKRNCTARFSLDRYGYLKSIKVQRALATPGATVGSTGYATFASSYALDLSTLTEGFTAYFASAAADGKVTMTKATDKKIAAGEGLFIQKTGGASAFTITETREATDDVENYLVAGDGVENGVAKEDGFDKYVLGKDGESVSFFLINETAATVAADKAYLKVPVNNAGARLAIVFGDEATGISDVTRNANNAESCYNLNGQRVTAPAKGLYIVNGKKVIKK